VGRGDGITRPYRRYLAVNDSDGTILDGIAVAVENAVASDKVREVRIRIVGHGIPSLGGNRVARDLGTGRAMFGNRSIAARAVRRTGRSAGASRSCSHDLRPLAAKGTKHFGARDLLLHCGAARARTAASFPA
jgi:hypothetical protein